jgi:hypothetical protein
VKVNREDPGKVIDATLTVTAALILARVPARGALHTGAVKVVGTAAMGRTLRVVTAVYSKARG